MTAMAQPLTTAIKPLEWAALFGFGQRQDPFWSRVRGAQIELVNRYVPFNATCLAVNIGALCFVMRGKGQGVVVTAFALALAAVCGLWLAGWNHRRCRAVSINEASQSEVMLVTAELLTFGVWWSLLLLYFMPLASPQQQVYLSLLSLAVIGVCTFATSILPTCGIAQVVMIALATLAGGVNGDTLASWPIQLCLVTFAVVMVRGTLTSSLSLIRRMQTEADHDEQNAVIGLLLREFETNGSDWLFEVDNQGRLTHVSPRFAAVVCRPREAMLGEQFLSMLGAVRGGEAKLAIRALNDHFAHVRPFRDLVTPVRVGGDIRWWQLSGSPKFDARGHFSGYRGVGSDITDVRLSHDRIAHLARFDPLTGLANRSLFRERLDDALQRATRSRHSCALLFVDLDRFKAVNDTLGHLTGDRLLREVSARLRQEMAPEAIIGRLGGDEFAVVLPNSSIGSAEAASRAIVAAMAVPFVVDGVPISIGASVGFALGPGDGATVDLLLRSADLALYEVKGSGRGSACRYVPAIKDKADERLALEADLRGAIAAGQLRLAYQPVVDAADEQVVGFEALLRWHHPEFGLIPPLKFIPIAEETGLIVDIGAWVIREACAQAAQWPEHIRIAVNLSPIQFEDPGLAGIVRAALAENRLAPDRLELEITESLFLNEQVSTLNMLAELKRIGISFALDDFGTGYSSLGYLQKVSFSRIKIDRSFVNRATVPTSEAVAIIQSIVALANSLGMATTAEGAETREEFNVIKALGCMQVQGYLFGRPMSPGEATDLVISPRLLQAAE